jgi:hypothetical protein
LRTVQLMVRNASVSKSFFKILRSRKVPDSTSGPFYAHTEGTNYTEACKIALRMRNIQPQIGHGALVLARLQPIPQETQTGTQKRTCEAKALCERYGRRTGVIFRYGMPAPTVVRAGIHPQSRRKPGAGRISLRKLIERIIKEAPGRLAILRRIGLKSLSFQKADSFCAAQEFRRIFRFSMAPECFDRCDFDCTVSLFAGSVRREMTNILHN